MSLRAAKHAGIGFRGGDGTNAGNVPVVAIVGQQDSMALGGSYQQEVDLTTLFKDVVHEFFFQLTSPSQIRHLVDRAMRIAKVERSVTCIIVPKDLQEAKYEEPPRLHGTIHSAVGITSPRVVPQERVAAAEILNAGAQEPCVREAQRGPTRRRRSRARGVRDDDRPLARAVRLALIATARDATHRSCAPASA